jgi:hypothetical protein
VPYDLPRIFKVTALINGVATLPEEIDKELKGIRREKSI